MRHLISVVSLLVVLIYFDFGVKSVELMSTAFG